MSNKNDKTNANTSGCIAAAVVVAAPKHSAPFHISNALFRNKRLKQKRIGWQQRFAQQTHHHQYTYARRSRTEGRVRNRLAQRQADVTIDLLSDEDGDADMDPGVEVNTYGQPTSEQQLQLFTVLPTHCQISDVPNITLIPVNNGFEGALARRKSLAPQRLHQATIVNSESIVLTDDDDDGESKAHSHLNNNNRSDIESCIPSTRISNEHFQATMKRQSTPKKATTRTSAPSTVTPPQLTAHVDDEVTVSIVPRSSTAGTCKAKSSPDEAFPMLPDETTVHTVIANRTYELSLTKLREGLASYAPHEKPHDEEEVRADKPVAPKPRRRKNPGSPSKQQRPPQDPIALKVSSDLSISLISDDEEEGVPPMNGDGGYKSGNSPPLLGHSTDARQVPRRRKLG